MRALILGAGGQVGRALAETVPASAQAIALGHAECDVRSARDVERAISHAGPDIVFNAAAFTAVDRAETEPEEAAAINAVAPGIIAQAARAAGARIVHISTDYVFDGEARRPYRPEDPPNPRSVYGRTKLAGEAAVSEADPGALVVRTSWIYASRGTNFVTTMLRLMGERERLQVVCDQEGAPTRAQSLAAALWTLAGAGASGLFHYRDGGTANWHQFATAIQEQALGLGLLRKAVPIEPIATASYPTAAPRPAYSVLDATHAWEIIGGPPPDWRDNLLRTLEDIREGG